MTTDFSTSPFSGEQQQRLSQLLAELRTDQIYWLAGYLSAYCATPSERGAVPSAPEQTTSKPELTILFGSQTGNAEGIAEQLAAQANDQGIVAKVVDLADYKPKQIKQEQWLALVTSTHGEGEPPDNTLDFHEYVMGKKAPKLDSLKFSVLALGDSSYEFFCETGKQLDQRFSELGGTAITERVDCDVDYEELAEQWISKLLHTISEQSGSSGPTVSGLSSSAATATESTYNRKNPFKATVLTNQLLNGRGSSKEVRHIEFSLEGSGLHYKPGDALAVCPENPPELVSELIRALGFDPNGRVNLADDEHSLQDALTHYREITLLTPPLLKQWAELADSDELCALVSDTAELRRWSEGRDLLDLIRQWPAKKLTAQQLVDSLRKLPPRLYSISSSQAADEDEVHITVAAVRYSSHGRDRAGVASTWLADRLEEGAEVPVYIDSNKNFALPDNDETPVIMIGPGTGVAPFRAFMQEREERDATGDNWLLFGDRSFRSDFLYQTEWLKWRESGLLSKLDVAFSRDQQEKRYVQHCLVEQGADVWAWLNRGAAIYVCGDADKMAPDVHQTLLSIVSEHGNMTAEQAEDFLRQMNRDKRYQRDVY
ncbi:assimilatory sulfite reductase (NADPH) flavoprotein subunit [Marinobacter sp.]|uniref:assimilatory sulfite reductase (NADPH) flavoprotein subunit n=1 Tax=Marinobacter sp. TaxID=50741 RepID=UPI003A951091